MMIEWTNIEWAQPWWFLGFVWILWWIYDHFFRSKDGSNDVLMVSHIGGKLSNKTWRLRVLPFIPFLKIFAISCILIALARPRIPLSDESIKEQGIDIMLVMDLSLSMLARDFTPDRLEASKKVAESFITKRPNDRIGLVTFSGESFTQCPLTVDHSILSAFVSSVQTGILKDGTAIGLGLASGVNRLKESDAKSKIIILLTDGVNNVGEIDPATAIELAKKFDIKVYTIGVGSTGFAETPVGSDLMGNIVYRNVEVKIDEPLLQSIASSTGGKYFRAVDESSLVSIYDEIDRLEKSTIETNVLRSYKDLFRPWLMVALGLLLLWWLLKTIYFTQVIYE